MDEGLGWGKFLGTGDTDYVIFFVSSLPPALALFLSPVLNISRSSLERGVWMYVNTYHTPALHR